MLLGREDEAAEALRPLAGGSVPGGIADFLVYGQFDPRPYPSLMAVLEREGIDRPAPVKIPFACPPPAASDKSVAVLPFLPLSAGADDEYFADGLTEEILNSLSQLPDLLVTARTSAFHFKGQDIPVPEIAGQLGVAHVVEGSVRRAGDRARITAQLIRASDGFHLWSETYDRTMDDVFAVQTDIAEKIATALDVVLDEDMRKAMRNAGARDVEAFIAFQKGRELYQLAHGERDQIPTLMEANGFIEQAIARVPDFATAYVIHSDLYTHILIDAAEGHRHEVVTDAMLAGAPERVRADYDAAVEHAESPSRRAYAELDRAFVLGDWRGIAALSDRALSAPGCDSPLWSQLTTSAFGKAREMAAATKRRIDCDPLSAADRVHIVRSLMWDEDVEGAIRLAGEAAGTVRAEWLIGAYVVALAAQGRLDEAGEVARTRLRSDTERLGAAALIASLKGDAATARAVEEELRQIDPRDGGARLRLAAWRGDHEEANRLAAEIDARPFGHLPLMVAIYQCSCGAPFDLESTPNFASMLEGSGLPWPPASPLAFPLREAPAADDPRP
jgi:TolB-like protein